MSTPSTEKSGQGEARVDERQPVRADGEGKQLRGHAAGLQALGPQHSRGDHRDGLARAPHLAKDGPRVAEVHDHREEGEPEPVAHVADQHPDHELPEHRGLAEAAGEPPPEHGDGHNRG